MNFPRKWAHKFVLCHIIVTLSKGSDHSNWFRTIPFSGVHQRITFGTKRSVNVRMESNVKGCIIYLVYLFDLLFCFFHEPISLNSVADIFACMFLLTCIPVTLNQGQSQRPIFCVHVFAYLHPCDLESRSRSETTNGLVLPSRSSDSGQRACQPPPPRMRHSCPGLPGSSCQSAGRLLALRPSNMLVYLRDGSAQTSIRAATLR